MATFTKNKQCYFCTNNMKMIDYKDIDMLKRYVDTHARIAKRRQSAVCALHQRKLSRAIKHARHLALLPFVAR